MTKNKKLKYENKVAKYAYTCAISFHHEIGEKPAVRLYGSIEEVKEHYLCWRECGVVRVKVTLDKYEIPAEDMRSNIKDSKKI